MAARRAVSATGVVLMLVAGLQGCCFRAGDAENGVSAPAAAVAAGRLHIVDWGPRRTRAGVVFNAQGNGHAAIWIRLDRAPAGITLVRFGDAFLEGDVSGNLVTAMVPAASYARPGVREVAVVARSDDAVESSAVVAFTVE